MCLFELSIAIVFVGYCIYMRHTDKREISYLERINVRLTEHIKLLKDDKIMDGIRAKSDGINGNSAYGEIVSYDEASNFK